MLIFGYPREKKDFRTGRKAQRNKGKVYLYSSKEKENKEISPLNYFN